MLNENRVLSRRSARVLTQEELDIITGSANPVLCTQACTFSPAYAGQSVVCDSECPKP